jgi:hypothetical protein
LNPPSSVKRRIQEKSDLSLFSFYFRAWHDGRVDLGELKLAEMAMTAREQLNQRKPVPSAWSRNR